MYLSRLMLNPLSRAVQRDLADCHALHRTVMSGFLAVHGASAPRASLDVLHRLEVGHRDGRITLLVQSRVEPDWSQLPRGYLLETGGDPPNPAGKRVDDRFRSLRDGSVLAFRLQANPTRKIDTRTGPDGVRRNGRRVELWREDDQIAWLRRKGEAGGFRVLCVRVRAGGTGLSMGAHGKITGIRPDPDGRRLTLASVLFEGELVVTDADAFLETLRRGVGSGKAYGLGLLSVAPRVG